MKIQSQGQSSLIISNKTNQVAFNPSSTPNGTTDIVALSTPLEETKLEAKKVFNTPGEFEVSGLLAEGLYTDDRNNVAYKVVCEDIAVVHFGEAKEVPGADFFEKLGENIDIIVLALSTDFDDKKAKTLIDKLDPRLAIIIGDSTYFAGMMANAGAKMAEETPLSVSKSSLSDDKTDVIILNTN